MVERLRYLVLDSLLRLLVWFLPASVESRLNFFRWLARYCEYRQWKCVVDLE
jgi:hypothetical protein